MLELMWMGLGRGVNRFSLQQTVRVEKKPLALIRQRVRLARNWFSRSLFSKHRAKAGKVFLFGIGMVAKFLIRRAVSAKRINKLE